MNQTWKIFQGSKVPHDSIDRLPSPPPWRRFGGIENESLERRRGSVFEVWAQEVELVNAALYLRRPLLVTGKPGTGKSSLAYAVAYELKLGTVLQWPISTRTTLNEGLYRYDAIGRLQDAQLKVSQEEGRDIGKYVQLGPLGTAFLPSKRPRVVLVDEIDKSDIDLPNDLLNIFEEGGFEIPELARMSGFLDIAVRTYDGQTASITKGRVQCENFPLVILTSNGERDFPPAFLRRCLQLEMPEPTSKQLERIVEAHFGQETAMLEQTQKLINDFVNQRDLGRNLATDQLLNAIFMLTGKKHPSEADREILLSHLLQPLDQVRGE
jgi:MoxR-like ATPase